MFVVVLVVLVLRLPVLVLMPAAFAMRVAAVDVKFHTLDVLPLRTVVVHVKMTEPQLFNLPFQRTGFHAEVDERTHRHVTADS